METLSIISLNFRDLFPLSYHLACNFTCRAYSFVFPLPVRIHFHRNACGNSHATGVGAINQLYHPKTQGTVLPSMPYWKYITNASNIINFVTSIHIPRPLWSLHFSSCVRHVLPTLLTNLHDQSVYVMGPIYKQFSDTQCIHVLLCTGIVVCISCVWRLRKWRGRAV